MSTTVNANLAALVQSVDLSADALNEAAHRLAAMFHRRDAHWTVFGTPEPIIRRQMRLLAKRHNVALPDKANLRAVINRLCDPSWWKRAFRKRYEIVEYAAIQSGQVHAQAGRYVSEKTNARAVRNKRRIAELLDSLVAINQTTGEIRPMSELAEASLSNPENRRRAMMARIKGIERHALAQGDEALFLTITCPSRMHARHFSGEPNARHDGTGPRQAQQYLNQLWRSAKRKLDHAGVTVSGVRIVEPHHDGCPHWHVLAFVTPRNTDLLIKTLREYALCDSPNEPGAFERRFVIERIDPARGSAVGYVAYFSPSWTAFQAERGRHFSVIVDGISN